MTTVLRTVGGVALGVNPEWLVRADLSGYLASDGEQTIVVRHDEEGAIEDSTAAGLILRGVLRQSAACTDGNPYLRRFLVASQPPIDVDKLAFILKAESSTRLGLEVACGYGHVTAPLASRKIRFEAIEENFLLAMQAHQRANQDVAVRIHCASIDQYVALTNFGWAFCAGDGIAELRTRVAIRSHFRVMRRNLEGGAPYLFRLRVVDRPARFEFDSHVRHFGEEVHIRCAAVDYSNLRRQYIEEVTIQTVKTGGLRHKERRGLASFGPIEATTFFNRLEGFVLEEVFNQDLRAIPQSEIADGYHWFLLRRVDQKVGSAKLAERQTEG